MIIDCHVHMNSTLAIKDDYHPEAILREMDRYHIDQAIVFPRFADAPDNKGLSEIVKQHSDRLIGFAWINPHLGRLALEELDRAVDDWGMKGVKLHPLLHAYFPQNPDLRRLFDHIAQRNVPVTIHSGHAPFSLPSQIAWLARDYPNVRIIMDHMGMQMGYVDEAIEYARMYPNLYLGTTAMPFHKKIAQAVSVIGSSRVMYGSDAPVIHPLVEMERVKVAGLSEQDEAMVLGGTVEKLLGEHHV